MKLTSSHTLSPGDLPALHRNSTKDDCKCKGQQNPFSVSTCVTALSSRGWFCTGRRTGGQLSLLLPPGFPAGTGESKAPGKRETPLAGPGGQPGWLPRDFHTKPISLQRKRAGQESVYSCKCHSWAVLRFHAAIKSDKVWFCLLLQVYLGSGTVGGERVSQLPDFTRRSSGPGVRALGSTQCHAMCLACSHRSPGCGVPQPRLWHRRGLWGHLQRWMSTGWEKCLPHLERRDASRARDGSRQAQAEGTSLPGATAATFSSTFHRAALVSAALN